MAKVKKIHGLHEHSGRRNSHLMAVAPNANSAIINDTSPSIEPMSSNAYTHRTRAGSFLVKNKYLEQLLLQKAPAEGKEEWMNQIWSSVILNNGSVQHLDCLDEYEKSVFKSSFEIDQRWVVEHAGDRQKYICQGQSVNLFFPHGSNKAYVNEVHLKAWKAELKGLYYLRTESAIKADKVSIKIERKPLADYVADKSEECIACEG
jgi:ribonucleoside-diphosphate reductase alpha chain